MNDVFKGKLPWASYFAAAIKLKCLLHIHPSLYVLPTGTIQLREYEYYPRRRFIVSM